MRRHIERLLAALNRVARDAGRVRNHPRCATCGRWTHRKAVRYFGGTRYVWACSWCDRGRSL